MARSARSSFAEGQTIIALLPPSSRMERPKRDATTGASALPIAVEPVALTTGTRRSRASASPASRAPSRTCESALGASPNFFAARSKRAWEASAVSGVFSDGFHRMLSPQTSASAAFHAQTATGKLKAEMTATGPAGCHCSIMRWPGRSDAMVRPYSWRERPTAKSQTSIISCTSPRPSCRIFPFSMVTRRPSASLLARSSSPRRRTSSPRFGAGTSRHFRKASTLAEIFASIEAASSNATRPISAPSIGEWTGCSPDFASIPKPERISAAFMIFAFRFTLPLREGRNLQASATQISGRGIGGTSTPPRKSRALCALDFRPSLKGRVVHNTLPVRRIHGASNSPCVIAAEAVGEEIAERRFFLPYEALLRQLAFKKQVAHRADARGGRDLDRAHQPVTHRLAVDFLRIAFLRQPSVHPARHGDEDQHHVLIGDRNGRLENVLHQLAPKAEAQIAHQHLDDVAVTGIAHRFVVQVLDLALQRVAKRAEPARGVEGLIGNAVERESLELLERRHLAAMAVADRLARVAVFVDQAVGRPGQVVFERVCRKHRQRAHAHLYVAERLEFLREVVGDDGNESGSQPALRNERGFRAVREPPDRACTFDVFGQVEIMRARALRRFGNRGGQRKWRCRKDHVLTLESACEFPRVADL